MVEVTQKGARRVAAAIAAILIAGSSVDRALADSATPPQPRASKSETTGVISGLAIGAAAGGPVGAILGAAGGGWLGDRFHRRGAQVDALATEVAQQQRERARLTLEIQQLNETLAGLESDLAERSASLANLQASSVPLDELAATVHFRTRDSQLETTDQEALQRLGALLAARTSKPVFVTGFADARGAAGFNYELSTARAEAVADALVEGGLAREQIAVVGAGAEANSTCLADLDQCAFERRVTVRMIDAPADNDAETADEAVAQVTP